MKLIGPPNVCIVPSGLTSTYGGRVGVAIPVGKAVDAGVGFDVNASIDGALTLGNGVGDAVRSDAHAVITKENAIRKNAVRIS